MEDGFLYDGNLLCLDLVNTVLVRDGSPVDLLRGPGALARWLGGAGVVAPELARELEARWTDAPEGSAALESALELRGAVRGIADRIRAGESPEPAHVAAVNRVLAAAPVVEQVVTEDDRFRVVGTVIERGAPAALAPVARSAAALLAELEWARLGKCSDPDCVLYFYDTSRNRSRRWCSMERCGNRAKVAAHYRRERA